MALSTKIFQAIQPGVQLDDLRGRGPVNEIAKYLNGLAGQIDAEIAAATGTLGDLAALDTVGTAQIDNDAVTYAKIQNVTDDRLLGRSAGTSGDVQEITVGSGLSLDAGALTATAAVALLDTQTASASATLDFVLTSHTATYSSFEFRLIGILPATDTDTLWIRTSTDGGANYDAGASDYDWLVHNDTSAINSVTGDTADDSIELASNAGNLASEAISGTVDLFGPTGTAGAAQFMWELIYRNATPVTIMQGGAGRRVAAADIDAVRFMFSTGNIASGTIAMYGIT